MNRQTLRLISLLCLLPLFALGQQFLDVDGEKGAIKPMIQKDKEIYHYSVLTELPFENNCAPELSEKERINCAEKKLRQLIYENLTVPKGLKGDVYVYLSVTKNGEITNVNIRNHTKTATINKPFEKAVHMLVVKPAIYQSKKVNTRLWTSFTFPSSSRELLSESFAKMKADENPTYEKYELLLFDAAEYIFSLPIFPESREFDAASNIIRFWMNKDTETGIPINGKFYNSLTKGQKFLYVIAVLKYQLDQKINHNRLLVCKPVAGQKFNEQEDVREVRLQAAKIMLTYISDKENNVPMRSKTKKFYKAFKKGKLKEQLFK